MRLIDSRRRRRVCDVGNGQDFVCYDQQGLEVGVSGFSFWGSGHNASVAPALHLLERLSGRSAVPQHFRVMVCGNVASLNSRLESQKKGRRFGS